MTWENDVYSFFELKNQDQRFPSLEDGFEYFYEGFLSSNDSIANNWGCKYPYYYIRIPSFYHEALNDLGLGNENSLNKESKRLQDMLRKFACIIVFLRTRIIAEGLYWVGDLASTWMSGARKDQANVQSANTLIYEWIQEPVIIPRKIEFRIYSVDGALKLFHGFNSCNINEICLLNSIKKYIPNDLKTDDSDNIEAAIKYYNEKKITPFQEEKPTQDKPIRWTRHYCKFHGFSLLLDAIKIFKSLKNGQLLDASETLMQFYPQYYDYFYAFAENELVKNRPLAKRESRRIAGKQEQVKKNPNRQLLLEFFVAQRQQNPRKSIGSIAKSFHYQYHIYTEASAKRMLIEMNKEKNNRKDM